MHSSGLYLEPSSRPSTLYLAYMFMLARRYAEASRLLDEARSDARLSEEERSILGYNYTTSIILCPYKPE